MAKHRRVMTAVRYPPVLGHIPALPDNALSWLAGELGSAERRATREIAERDDLAEIAGHTFVVAPVSRETIDALVAFEAEGEDRETVATSPDAGTDQDYGYGPSVGVTCRPNRPRCDIGQQPVHGLDIVALARRQGEGHGIAQGIDEGVELAGRSAPAASDGLVLAAFLRAPAPC